MRTAPRPSEPSRACEEGVPLIIPRPPTTPRAAKLAAEAYRRIGMEPDFQFIRGGTDGSRLSEMGLPTPNLSTGMHNFHSELEFACLEQMETSVKVLTELAQLWGQEK